MKLRNKLIPLGSVFATCATIAPIALTSCSNGQMVDLLTYTPSEAKAKVDGNKLDQEHGMQEYISAIQKDAKVFYNDAYNSIKYNLQGLCDQSGYVLNQLKSRISDLSVNWTKVGNDTYALANFKVQLLFDWTDNAGSEESHIVKEDNVIQGTATFTNVPLWVDEVLAEKEETPFSQWTVSPIYMDYNIDTVKEAAEVTCPNLRQCQQLEKVGHIDWQIKCDYKYTQKTTYNHDGQLDEYNNALEGVLDAHNSDTVLSWFAIYEEDGKWYTKVDSEDFGIQAYVFMYLANIISIESKYMSDIAYVESK